LGTALVAPLATSSGSAGAVTIGGAQSLADKVAVQFTNSKDRTTDVHLLAFNDLHGTLDPAAQNIYGRFAGGAAFLAKAIKDRQGSARSRPVSRRRFGEVSGRCGAHSPTVGDRTVLASLRCRISR